MDSLSNNILPNGSVIKCNDEIYQTGGYEIKDGNIYYLVTSSIGGGGLGEIEDSNNLLLRDGEKRIHRVEFRPDFKETQSGL